MEENKSSFLRAESRLTSKKEDLWNNGNVSKWELTPEDEKIKFNTTDKILMTPKMLPKVFGSTLNLNRKLK